MLDTVNPFAKTNPYTNYQCAVALVTVADGLVQGEPAAILLSDRLKVIANVDVDLSSEAIDVVVRTVPQKGLGISVTDLVNPYVKVGGTLASPSLVLDPEGAVIEGGAAIATGGLSFLAKRVSQRFFSSKDPCGDAVRDAEPAFREIHASILGEPVDDDVPDPVAEPSAQR